MRNYCRDAAKAFATLFWWRPPSLGALIGTAFGIGISVPLLLRSDALLALFVNVPALLLLSLAQSPFPPEAHDLLVVNMVIWGGLGALVHFRIARQRRRDAVAGSGEPDTGHRRPDGGISPPTVADGPQLQAAASDTKDGHFSMIGLVATLFWHGRYSLGTLVGTALGVAFSLLLFLAPDVARHASLPALALALPLVAAGGMGPFLVGLSVFNMVIWGGIGTFSHFTIVRLAQRASPEQEVGSSGDSPGGNAPTRVAKVFKICILAMFVLLGVGVLYWFHRPIPLPRGHATRARITIWPPANAGANALGADEEPQSHSVSTDDENAVAELVSVLRTARANRDHKCGDRGGITLTFPAGDVEVDLLPGHTPGYYELRYHNRNYRLEQAPLIKALVGCGVAAEKIP